MCVGTLVPCDLIYSDKATGPNNKNVYFSLVHSLSLSLHAPGEMEAMIKQNKPTGRMSFPKSHFWNLNPLLYVILIILHQEQFGVVWLRMLQQNYLQDPVNECI